MNGNNLWKIDIINENNLSEYNNQKIVEGNWKEVCTKYNPTYDANIKISPLQNYKNDLTTTLQYFGCDKKEPEKIHANNIVNKTLDVIGEYYGEIIQEINDKIKEASSNGENQMTIYEINLEDPERLKYYYTKLGYNFAYVNENLRILW